MNHHIIVGKLLKFKKGECGFCGEVKPCVAGPKKTIGVCSENIISYENVDSSFFSTGRMVRVLEDVNIHEVKAAQMICGSCSAQISQILLRTEQNEVS